MSQSFVYIGLGSNLGDREKNLLEAVRSLRRIDDLSLSRCSSLFESAAIGPAQPAYLNAVVEAETGLSPAQLLSICKQIEKDLGRKPGTRWGPRELDLDLLLWGDRVVADPALQIPHVELHKRRFALEPLAELCPDARHPLTRETVGNLLRKLEPQDVRPYESALFPPHV